MNKQTTRRKSSVNAILKGILACAARGWRVVPLNGKKPAIKNWPVLATTDTHTITQWATSYQNFGIATGKASNVLVLDVDPRHGGDKTLLALEAEFGELPKTVMVRTGNEGRHYYFCCPDITIGNSANKLGPGLDMRGEGGQVVAPSSIHPETGKAYKWDAAHHPDKVPVAPMPVWMLDKLAPTESTASDEPTRRGRPRKDDPQRRKYGLSEVREMLAVIPADDRDLWLKVGIILGRMFQCSDDAWKVYIEWADKWDGPRDQNHDKNMRDFFYTKSQQPAERELSIGTVLKVAMEHGWAPRSGNVPVEDFAFYGPDGTYLYLATLDPWPTTAVNVAVSPVNIGGQVTKATEWLKTNRCVTSLARDPIIEGTFAYGMNCVNGELIHSVGACVLNTYRRPTIELGDPAKAGAFVEHVRRLMPNDGDADQFLNYMAHRAQHPGVKPRFALLIGGEQGVGKDTAIDMCVPTFGVWNVSNIAPSALSTQFNEFVASTLVRISETANQKEMSRFVFNELVKTLIAGSPDYCVVNPKYGHKYTVRLHCGVCITSNYLLTGIYVPRDDRRYDAIQCSTKTEMGLEDDATRRTYFEQLWSWFYHEDGARHIAAFLHARDLTGFSPNNGQRKTAAHQMIIQNSMSGDEWFYDALEAIGNPDLFRGDVLMLQAVRNSEDLAEVRAKLPHAAERAGFKRYLSPTRDGRWPLGDKRKCALFLRQGVAIPTKAEREQLLKQTPDEVLTKY